MFDLALLDEREIPLQVVDPLGALLLAPGTLAALGVAEGNLIGLRLTAKDWRSNPSPRFRRSGLGARLAALLNDDEPVFFNAAVWTACADIPHCSPNRWHRSARSPTTGLPYEDEWLGRRDLIPSGVSSVGAPR